MRDRDTWFFLRTDKGEGEGHTIWARSIQGLLDFWIESCKGEEENAQIIFWGGSVRWILYCEQGKWVGSEEEWVSWEMGWADFNLEELKHKETWAGRKGEEGPK